MEPNINDMANPSNMAAQAVRTATDPTPAAPTLTIRQDSTPVLCTLHPDGSITGDHPELCRKPIEPLSAWIIMLLGIAAIFGIIKLVTQWRGK